MVCVLVIDDDPEMRNIITQLSEDIGHPCENAGDLSTGLQKLAADSYDLVFLDVKLPDGSGISVLPIIRKGPGQPDVIIITGLGDPDGAELAIQNGAWDYIEKTSSLAKISFSMERALKYRERHSLALSPIVKRNRFIGDSPALRPVLDNMAIAAAGDVSVLVTGETGTGKEVVARTIHDNSNRSSGPFVVLDCTTLPENLVEGELFGHAKGAFTGADSTRKGVIGEADGGTLFLDELGELPQSIQTSFLRVVQEKRYRPVGTTKEQMSDFRLISATNRNLEEMCGTGEFRADLYFRLKSCSIHLPPLRERFEDIPALMRHHHDRLCSRLNLVTKDFSEELLSLLMHHQWPGNVRELVQVLERTLMRARDEQVLYPEHLPVDIRAKAVRRLLQRSSTLEKESVQSLDTSTFVVEPAVNDIKKCVNIELLEETLPFKEYRQKYIRQIEKAYIERLIASTNGRIKDACKRSGLSRTRLYVLMKLYNITRNQK